MTHLFHQLRRSGLQANHRRLVFFACLLISPGVANTNPGLEERQGLFSEDPLLRSGLILAGADQLRIFFEAQ